MKWFVAGTFLGIVIAGIIFVTAQGQEHTPGVLAQDGVRSVTNVQVHSGSILGEVIISWDAVPQATHYRIGYVNMEIDYHLAKASCTGEWIDAFVYVDADARNIPVRNGRAEYTVRRLAPGARHAFTVLTGNDFVDSGGSVRSEFFWPSNPRWKFLDGRDTLPSGITRPTGECAPLTNEDYDTDDDGLIEVSNLAQLNAMRWDLDGDGYASDPRYAQAFPHAPPEIGCPSEDCVGYELTANLDFDTNGNGRIDAGDEYWNDGAGWLPLGDSDDGYSAIFDGNGNTIANLYMNRDSEYVGLFGFADYSYVKGIGLVSVDVSGAGHVGSLVGFNKGVIYASYATGRVVGYNNLYTGGLVGGSVGAISASYTMVNVTCRTSFGSPGAYVGGLVGESNGSTIIASYATGRVYGQLQVGGLVGGTWWKDTTIVNSYATGRVISIFPQEAGGLVAIEQYEGRLQVYNSYWDTQTSGINESVGGVGKSTSELRSPTGNTGIYATWNPDWWDFGTSRQYPVLKYGRLDPAAQR